MPWKNPEDHRAYERRRYANNPTYFSDYAKTHAAQINKRNAQWKKNHPETVRAQSCRYRQRHPEAKRAQEARRRARKRGATGLSDLTHAQWLEIQAAQDHRCYYCGKRRKGKLTQDHIIPVSKGGSHTLHNVIGACGPCNSRKGTKKPPMPVQPLLLTVAPPKQPKKAS